MENIIYVGADVHKDTNSVCMFDWNDGSFFAEAVIEPGVENMVKYAEKARKEYGLGQDCRFLIGYEAGPTGYGLCRGLQKKGYDCVIMAPTTIKKSSSDKRKKTDRRDAKMLAMALATDTYRRVYVLDDEDEGTREFTRARNSMLRELRRAKQMLLSFLLRLGRSYPDSGNYWTLKHREWLETIKFEDRKLNYAYQSYLQQIKDLEAKLALMDDEIENIADEDRYKDKVDKLVCFKGIDTQTALTLVVEIGDFERFATAEQFASYIGLVPGEDSSGQKKRIGSITKEGNSRVRLVLTEAAKAIKRSNPFNKSKRILERQKGQSPEIIAYADRGSKRIRQKMARMDLHGKNKNVSTTAGARELACFIWGMMTGNIV